MKIGIIVYSQTGNTLSVANQLYEKLKSNHLDVVVEKIEAERDRKKNSSIFEITNFPKIDNYDVIIIGSYIEAFSLCPVMKRYLESLSSLNGKKIFSFVTQHFAYPWLGGNNGLKKIHHICKDKGQGVDKGYVINWSNKKRENMIKSMISDLAGLLK